MAKQHYQISFTVDATPQGAFKNINDVTRWWTENIEGGSQKLNDEFTVRFGDVHYSKQKLVEVITDEKVTWLVTDSKLNFLKDRNEWTGTKISFQISRQDKKTKIIFTHVGLVPDIECYDACSNAWSGYVSGSLLKLITTGRGSPERRK
jgi:hypothetical protein